MFYGTLPEDTQDFRQVLAGIGRTIRDRAAAAGQRIGQSGSEAIALQNQIFGDPNRPLRVTDENALRRYTDMIMGGPLGFAPTGMISQTIAAKALPQTKILDESGNPQLMYHGTTKEFKNFKKNVTLDDHVPGISVTDEPWMASGYAKQVEGSNVRPVYIDAKNPIKYENLEEWALQKAKQKGMKIKDEEDFAAFDIPQNKLVKWLKEDGYDAIDYRSDPMLGYGLRVFDPKQIKSAISDPAFAGLLD